MGKLFLEPKSILFLMQTDQNDYIKSVIDTVLDNRQNISKEQSKRFREVLKKKIKIKGYRPDSLYKAPVAYLKRALTEALNEGEIISVLLYVWVDLNPELLSAVDNFIMTNGLPHNCDNFKDNISGVCSRDEFSALVKRFQGEIDGYPDDAVSLMLCLQTGLAPIEQEIMVTLESDFAPPAEKAGIGIPEWDAFLDYLQTLPCESNQWSKIDNLIQKIKEISTEKCNEVTKYHQVLENAISFLISETRDQLEYFEFQDVLLWDDIGIDTDQPRAISQQINNFTDQLKNYQKVMGKPYKNLGEKRERDQLLNELEETILEQYKALRSQFSESKIEDVESLTNDPEISSLDAHIAQNEPTSDAEQKPKKAVVEEVSSQKEEPSLEEPSLNEESDEDPAIEQDESGAPSEIHLPFDEPLDEDLEASLEGNENQPASPEIPEVETEDSSDEVLESGAETAEELATLSFERSDTPLTSSSESVALPAVKLFWDLIRDDDLPAAYWLSESVELQEAEAPAPPWLIKVVQGARWLSPEHDDFVEDVLSLVEHNHPKDKDVEIILGLAASLRASLIAPYSGLISWLQEPNFLPEVKDLVKTIKDFASKNIILQPIDIDGAEGANKRTEKRNNASVECKKWLEDAPKRRTKFKRASDVWWTLIKEGGEIATMLTLIIENDPKSLELVQSDLQKLRNDDYIHKQIDTIDRRLYMQKAKPIVGPSRDQIVRYVKEACKYAETWCRWVERERDINSRGSWIFDQITELRNKLGTQLPKAYEAINESILSTNSKEHIACFFCLKRSILQLQETLRLQISDDQDFIDFSTWEFLSTKSENLNIALSRRLLLFPQLELTDSGVPDSTSIMDIEKIISQNYVTQKSHEISLEGWIDKQDYRFVDLLLDYLDEQDIDTQIYLEQINEAKIGSKSALEERISATIDVIEQAVVDDIIEDKRSEMIASVEAINPANEENFYARYIELDNIKDSIHADRLARMDKLKLEWVELQKEIKVSSSSTKINNQIFGLVSNALEKNDSRLVEEFIARISNIIQSDSEFETGFFPLEKASDTLINYYNHLDRIEDWLKSSPHLRTVEKNIIDGNTRAGLKFGEIPPPRRKEAANALSSWAKLKRRSGLGENRILIASILQYLGFSFFTDKQAAINIRDNTENWIHATAQISASGLAKPIYHFGSASEGNYHVVCLWNRPNPDTVAARINELKLERDNVLILFFGRITRQQHKGLLNVCWKQNLSIAVLDENLMVYLAHERGSRLPKFLQCALPLSSVNPYTPFKAGDVPPEMFFGRSAMARELQRSEGSCLLYGGRQLGKSALLKHVARQYHFPERKQYAYVTDIKLIGDPLSGQPINGIWYKLRDSFKELGLLSSRITTERPDEIERHIRKCMKDDKDVRVLIMFDEADNLLDADSQESFKITERLRSLMVDTERRFKVIFAGLHNVQRFQGIPNQPLAHFGRPILVGPLEPEAAQELIRSPMEILGFRFNNDAGPLRILSYTNYHPGLIQVCCQELLSKLRKGVGRNLPPHNIRQKDIEAIYRKVRDQIKERFDWTLALDMRYETVAWAMIVDQLDTRNGFSKSYDPSEILSSVQTWWPNGFNSTSLAELGSLLGEMIGLGVLVKDSENRFRLRSPNLVRLMGSVADIERQLEERMEEEPPVSYKADSHHAPLDQKARRYNPLTYQQARDLNQKNWGVSLLLGSEATGLSLLPKSFTSFLPPSTIDMQGSCTRMPLHVIDKETIQRWLDINNRKKADEPLTIFYHEPMECNQQQLALLVEGALNFCRRHQSRRRILRVFFILDSIQTLKWLSIPKETRDGLESRLDISLSLNRWNAEGIRQRLVQHDIMHSKNTIREIMKNTGGWPILLDSFFDRCGPKDNPKEVIKAFWEEIADHDSAFSNRFTNALGIKDARKAQIIFKFLLSEKDPIPIDLITPELIPSSLLQPEAILSNEDCQVAIGFLNRMGCVDIDGEYVQPESILRKISPFE